MAQPHALDRGRLVDLHVDREQGYALMADRAAGIAVLEILVPWVVGYCVYFWLSPEELTLFEQDKPAFDAWTRTLAMDKGEKDFGHRLLLHQGPGGDTHPAPSPHRIEDLDRWIDRLSAPRYPTPPNPPSR